MKPTQQEIIEQLGEAFDRAVEICGREFVANSLLERFGAGDGEPVAWIYWHPSDDTFDGPDTIHKKAVSRFTDDTRLTMQRKGWRFEPLYTHPSPTDLRAEYERGLDDAAKVARAGYDTFWQRHEPEFPKATYDQASVLRTLHSTVEFVSTDIADAIEALKGK